VKAMFGISTDVPVSMADFYSGLHPADRGRTSDAFAAACDPTHRAVYDVEYRTVGKEDGAIRWVAAKGRGIFDSSGRCIRVIGTAIDISSRKRVEERLRQQESLIAGQKEAFQAAVNGATLEVSLGILTRVVVEQFDNQARAAIYIADSEGKALRHIVGMPEDYAQQVMDFPIGSDSFSCGLAVHRGQPVVTRDVTREPLWREMAWLAEKNGFRACWSFPVETSAGKMVGSFALYFKEPRDATAQDRNVIATVTQAAAIIVSRHQETEERTRATEALEAADRHKNEFLAMLAHELRNPLAPIGNASELLARTVTRDARAGKAIAMIRRQTSQLTRLVDDLLDVSRITQGRIELQQRPIDLATVVAQAVEMLEPQLREYQHELSILTLSYEPLFVNGDVARLVQCVGNILANAIKYTEPGGKIRIQTRADENRVVLEIADNGSGIAPDMLPKVFDLFVQGDRTLDRARGGLGIGLSLVKRLVQMHDGDVSIRSEGIGTGATVEVRLPRIGRSDTRFGESAPNQVASCRILIVDDNRDAAQSLAMLLTVQGHTTQVAYSGKEALERAVDFRPDVGLLDIGLPEMSGYELAHAMRARQQQPGLRLIALTGYGQPEDRERALSAGFDYHLIKPVDFASLERTLTALAPHTAADCR
jgi:PAS domain S-box-containing protein